MPGHLCVVFQAREAQRSRYSGDPTACRAEHIYYPALWRKSWPTFIGWARQPAQRQDVTLGRDQKERPVEAKLELVITVALLAARPLFLSPVASFSLRGLLTPSEQILF